MFELIQRIMKEGAFAIPRKPGLFAQHIGKTAADIINDEKQSLDKRQKSIQLDCKAPTHELDIYFELLNALMLARDLKYLAEKLQDGKIDETTAASIVSGYQDLLRFYEKEEVLNTVLQAAETSDINKLVGLKQENNIELSSFHLG